MLQKYNSCIYCGTSSLKRISKIKNTRDNFYLRAIRSDLGLSKKKLEKK